MRCCSKAFTSGQELLKVWHPCRLHRKLMSMVLSQSLEPVAYLQKDPQFVDPSQLAIRHSRQAIPGQVSHQGLSREGEAVSSHTALFLLTLPDRPYLP